MLSCGQRAAKAIRERSEKNGTSIREECRKLNMETIVHYRWERGDFNPSAYFLKQMALAGYDVIYILTGKE